MVAVWLTTAALLAVLAGVAPDPSTARFLQGCAVLTAVAALLVYASSPAW